MPTAGDTPKRPGLVSRHSASASYARSPGDNLSSSASKPKGSRHVVGGGRLGPRVPSYKNVKALSKLTQVRPQETSTSPRNGHIKRNSSGAILPSASSNVALRKNHSETSLKKNRSSGQLTRLARPASSRNVTKAVKRLSKGKKSSTNLLDPDDHVDPKEVRFNLGHDDEDDGDVDNEGEGDGWSSVADSRSPSTTRSNTRCNSMTSQHARDALSAQNKENDPPPLSDEQRAGQSSDRQGHAPAPSDSLQPAQKKPGEANKLTSRLLKRNVSFNVEPQVSSVSATPITVDPHDHHAPSSGSYTDGSNPHVVSRFLNSSSASTSAGTHDSSFLPSRSMQSPPDQPSPDNEDEAPRRNKSAPNFAAMRVSRTQQRLNLERESASIEPQAADRPPIALMRASRLSSANIPFYAVSEGGEGHLHPQLRQLFDQTAMEYRRIRMYHHPLADSVKRLQDAGIASRTAIPSKGNKSDKTTSLNETASHGLSQSWRSHKSADSLRNGHADSLRKSAAPAAATNSTGANGASVNGTATTGESRRPRVMFQGIRESNDDDRGRLDGTTDERAGHAPTEREEIRQLCRRLWSKRDVGGVD